MIYGAHPQHILENPAAELIQTIPSVWDVLRMRAVNHQRRGKDKSRSDLVRPGSLPPALAEMHRSVIRVPGEKPRERQRRIVH